MSEYVYDLAKRHHSVRKFKQTPIERATIEKLIEAGQMASTSSFLQTTSFIGVESIERKRHLEKSQVSLMSLKMGTCLFM